jgi:hypothetical protein
LAGDEGGGVGEEGGLDEFLALVELGGGRGSEKDEVRSKKENGPAVTDRRYKLLHETTHFGGRR